MHFVMLTSLLQYTALVLQWIPCQPLMAFHHGKWSPYDTHIDTYCHNLMQPVMTCLHYAAVPTVDPVVASALHGYTC